MEENGALDTVERRVRPQALGYPLTAFITAEVIQRQLAEVAARWPAFPRGAQVHGISGRPT